CGRPDGPSDTPPGRRAINQPCPSSPAPAGHAADSVPGARPPFFAPLDTSSNRGEAVVEFEPRGFHGWASLIREGTPHCRTIAPHDFSFRVTSSFEAPFDGASPPHTFF